MQECWNRQTGKLEVLVSNLGVWVQVPSPAPNPRLVKISRGFLFVKLNVEFIRLLLLQFTPCEHLYLSHEWYIYCGIIDTTKTLIAKVKVTFML